MPKLYHCMLHHRLYLPSMSIIVTVVTAFPSLRLVPASVSRESSMVKLSSDSTRLSEATGIEVHTSVSLAAPLAKVKVVEAKEKSPSLVVAVTE